MSKKCKKLVVDPEHITPQAYLGPNTGKPLPEEAIVYFRASSVGLYLDGYNNTFTFASEMKMRDPPFQMIPDAEYTAIPSYIDSELRDCLIQTIAQKVPLVNGAASRFPSGQEPNPLNLMWLALVVWWMM